MTLAQYAMLLIIGWQTYNIARDGGMSVGEASGQLALIGLLQFAPLFVLTPFSGLVADRMNRRNVARFTTTLQLLCAAVLGWMTYSDAITLTVLFSVAVALGVARAFSGPALGALAPNLVPAAILPKAIAMSSISWQVGMIVGPALGGRLYEEAPHLPYTVAGALFIVSINALGFIGKVAFAHQRCAGSDWSDPGRPCLCRQEQHGARLHYAGSFRRVSCRGDCAVSRLCA